MFVLDWFSQLIVYVLTHYTITYRKLLQHGIPVILSIMTVSGMRGKEMCSS